MIFEQEIKDGLEEALASHESIAYCSPVSLVDNAEIDMPSLKKLVIESSEATNLDQMDLYYLSSVLVSTGWNKNDDVFTNAEIWAARNTPEDKQLNYMHDESDIIGHITASKVVDRQGNVITSDPPDEFDIITNGVIYTNWSDEEADARINKLIAEIKEGKWHVSMECLFAGFDYAVITPEGEHKVLARNEDSAFLTKHLRKYGGKGSYEGYKIGRALRNVVFSGKGLVSNPANPRSVILNETQAFHASSASELFTVNDLGDNEMADSLETQVAELKSELAKANDKNEAIRTEVEEAKAKEYETQISNLTETVASLTTTVEEKSTALTEAEAKITELDATIATKDEELAAAKKEVKDYEDKDKKQKRKDKMVEAGLKADSIEETLETLASLEDAAFDAVLATMVSNIPAADETEETEAEADESAEEEAEAEEEAFDDVETTEAALVSDDDGETESAQASMAEWYSENFLN